MARLGFHLTIHLNKRFLEQGSQSAASTLDYAQPTPKGMYREF